MRQKKKRKAKAKEHNIIIREHSDLLKVNNIQIIGVPENERKENG